MLPLENATLTDETFTFKDAGGKDVTGVEWYVESIVIGAADYEATAYDDTPSDAPIYANLRTKGATTAGASTPSTPSPAKRPSRSQRTPAMRRDRLQQRR